MRLPAFLKDLFQPIPQLRHRPDASRQRVRVILRLPDHACMPIEVTVRGDTPAASLLAVAAVNVVIQYPKLDFLKVEAVHLPSATPCPLLAKHLARSAPTNTQTA